MKKALINTAVFLFIIVTGDVAILLVSILQMEAEGRTGHWIPFWRIQAEFLARLLT